MPDADAVAVIADVDWNAVDAIRTCLTALLALVSLWFIWSQLRKMDDERKLTQRAVQAKRIGGEPSR